MIATLAGFFVQRKALINLKRLSTRIKKNEGYSNKIYNDQLNNLTIGYGHLVLKKDNFQINKKYSKIKLDKVFKQDLNIAIKNYEKIFSKQKLPCNVSEAIIEMIFQLGPKKFKKFKKMINALKKNDFKKAAEEMINSVWYLQTPNRVRILTKLIQNK